ncbi:amidase [Sphingopyxis fribergensis]|uniref:amidase n=1 Tax=Sphingopyxis fribergensis TaxID=1515612 RepID=UPI001E3708AE|nr:amidase [Sphingopyxis fribergensis]
MTERTSGWLAKTSLVGQLSGLVTGEVTSVDLVTKALVDARMCQTICNAFASIAEEQALAAARSSDTKRTRRGKVEGLPILLKDNIDTHDIVTAYGSRAYRNHVPERDAPLVRRLKAEGGIILGKTTTHEFAWGVTTQSTAFGITRNPHDRSRIPGGSSGGLAAAIASGVAGAGIGSDTGGSVRIPAALCGVVGFKPSAGLWPLEGFFPLAATLDHPGIIGASVDDVIVLASALGLDLAEDTGAPRVEYLEDLPGAPLDSEVRNRVKEAIDAIAMSLPVQLSNLRPLFAHLFPVFAGTVLAEAGMVHFARSSADTIASLYDPDTQSRLERSRLTSLAEYEACQQQRRSFVQAFKKEFRSDFLILPTCICTAPRIGEDEISIGSWAGTVREALMAYTSPFNLNGYPAISLPLPTTAGSLPAGIQIVGRPGGDGHLLRFAATVEAILASPRRSTLPSKETEYG